MIPEPNKPIPPEIAAVCARLRREEATTADLDTIARLSLEGIRQAFIADGRLSPSETNNEELFEFHLAGKVASEGAEVLDAYQRWTGWSRRTGDFSEVEDESADVMVAALLLMHQANGALWTAMADKVEKIFTRGWKDMGEAVRGTRLSEPSVIREVMMDPFDD